MDEENEEKCGGETSRGVWSGMRSFTGGRVMERKHGESIRFPRRQ